MAETTAAEDKKFYLLGKELAHTDKSIRDKAVEKIRVEVASTKEATELEMMKLWKGLFYTFWMSDKPDVQEELAISLSLMIQEFRTDSLSISYIRCFWKTVVREWGGIDRYRMDKYLLLIRKIMDQTFVFINTKKWRSSLVEEYQSIVLDIIGNTDFAGICGHYCDCFLEELHDSLPHISTDHFLMLLTPIVEILKIKKNPVIVNSIRDRVFMSLVNEYETKRELESADSSLPSFDDVDIRFIHVAYSKDSVNESSRKVFNDLELAYETKAKERFTEIDIEKIEQKKTSSPKKDVPQKKQKKVVKQDKSKVKETTPKKQQKGKAVKK